MKRMFRALFPLPILALMALLPAAARSADTPPSFGESIDVRVVNLEAVVTDRDGKLVTGLKPADFRLRVDGQEVPIEYFNEVHDGQALAAPAGEARPEGGAAAVQGLAEGKVGTYYLVFIDDYFSIAASRDVVLKGLKADLGRMGPDDRMAIVAYDGGRLAMLSNWSGSQADLARAFDQAMARKSHGLDRVIERGRLATDESFASQSVGDEAPLDLASHQVGLNDRQTAYADTLIRQVKGDVQAAVSAMRAFAGPQGRKVMLLLSGGWPFSAQSYTSGGGLPTKQLAEGEEVFRPLASTANLLGYTLYPVDVPGIQTGAANAEATGPAVTPFGSDAEQEIEGSLKFLAQQTGGKPLLNSNRTVALASAREDTRSFYWLGFSPSWQRNDKTHDVKLEARRSGLRIRTRSSYLDLSRKAEVTMKVESALLLGNPPDALRMPLKAGEIVRSKRGEIEIPLSLALPVDVMTVLPEGNKFAAQLELRFAASDSEGNTANIPVLPVNLSSDHPPVPGKFVKYETNVKVRGKIDHLVVALYDPLSGKIATAETDVKMP